MVLRTVAKETLCQTRVRIFQTSLVKLKMACCRFSLLFRRLGKTRRRFLMPLTVWQSESSGLPWSA